MSTSSQTEFAARSIEIDPESAANARASLAWEGFVAGSENQLAQAAVQAMASGNREGVSPLVLHGPTGSGKTRLLNALAIEFMHRQKGSAIAHFNADVFQELCAERLANSEDGRDLSRRLRGVELVILDDLNTLENDAWAWDELEHVVNQIDLDGGSIAVAARNAPSQWTNWPTRLVDRLNGGLSIALPPPSKESLLTYISNRSLARGIRFTSEALELISRNAATYRDLDGWLARLALNALNRHRHIDRSILAELWEEDPARHGVPIEVLALRVAGRFGVNVRGLKSQSRRSRLVEPRHCAMYLARRLTSLSHAEIGAFFGRRDRASVRHGCEMIEQRIANEPQLEAIILTIERALSSTFGTPLKPSATNASHRDLAIPPRA